jgi:DNA-directed RNA polymerase specialized sigma24 family protein
MQDSMRQRGRVHSAPHLRLLTWEGSDAELLDRVASGDADAALRFHDRFGNDVHALVRALVGPDPAQAQLVESSLLLAYSGLYSKRVSVGQLPAWVEQHTVKVVRRYLRKRGLARRFRSVAPRFELDTTDDVLVFYERVTDLAPELRIAFCLRYVAGRALSDTARLCGCSVSELRSRLDRAEAYVRAVSDIDVDYDLPDVGWES